MAVDSVPETEYDCREKTFKQSATTGRSGRPAPRAILGWSPSTEMDDAAAALHQISRPREACAIEIRTRNDVARPGAD